ncbi:peptidylprolyl isomerase [Paenibacillus sp. 481]|uniref:peptidylprolyl isomerase n=1 Tax=Paenibacillus sp. 481 TaxID=2835869 RepID=UPI001E5D1BAB|nr:peptidylprolyl isomerase [Paenibacillus sp. 481]UHA75306.1 peptidylprolyl isomerase [Paenibacillus sp. 481]
MTKEVKSLWGCIIVLFTCVIVLASILISRLDVPSAKPDARPHPDTSTVVATLGDEKVTKAEWDAELERQYGYLVLEEMLTSRAAVKEAATLGIDITPDEVELELKRRMAGYESEQAYFEAMKQQLGMTPTQIRTDLSDKLLLEKIATFDVAVTEDEIDRHLRDHADIYVPVNQLELSHIVVSTQREARGVLERISKGELFQSLAEQVSNDAFSALQGGKLGWIDEDDPFVSAAELEAAKQLDIGGVSEPIRVDDGYAIVQLTGKKEAEPLESAIVRQQVRRDIALSKARPLPEVEDALREKHKAAIYLSSDSNNGI